MEFKYSGNKTSTRTLFDTLKIAFLTFIGIILFEYLKHLISPGISIWQSHIITIIFSTVIASVASYIIVNKQQKMNTELQKAKEDLNSERQRLYLLLDTLPAFVYLQAPDYSISFANKYYKDRFGETEGVPCYQSLWGRDKPCEPCFTFKVFETKKPQVWQWDSAPDGRVYTVYDYLFTDSSGKELVLELGVDITEQKNTEKAREELISHLEQALSEIKTLQDILPICSFCKNIRNDEGYYEQIEAYINRHTGSDFSHTICEPCMKKHYPEEYEQILLDKKK